MRDEWVQSTGNAALLGDLRHYDDPLLVQAELAQRWRLSERTLEKWRSTGRGVRWIRLGRRVVYRLSDVERFEAEHQTGPGARLNADRLA